MKPHSLLVALVVAAGTFVPASAQQTDLDQLMAEVLATRDENWKKLQQYILEERESFDLTGPGGHRLYGFRRDHSWFMRDGVFIRSPVRADGVTVSEPDRRKAEADWIEREESRRTRERERAEREAADPGEKDEAGNPAEEAAPGTPSTLPSAGTSSIAFEPAFVSHAYFLRFKFEEGRYALAGRETLDGQPVLRIEYYPSLLFRDGRTRPNRRVRDREEDIEDKMNKVSLVTLWVDPANRQILQYTFDDIDMDFLPGRSLARVDDVKATMRMGQPFAGVWLPQSVEMQFGMTLAVGTLDAGYRVEYHDYREAEVSTKVLTGVQSAEVQGPRRAELLPRHEVQDPRRAELQFRTEIQSAEVRGAETPRVVDVRVHGNHTTPTEEILAMAGAVSGAEATDALVSDVRTKLGRSGRFAGVSVERRQLTITDPSRVLLVIIVDERPGVAEDDLTPGAWKRLTASGMWLPLVSYAEGYGFTYGARFSFVDTLGPRSRISVPLTWGGERQARVEVERGFERRAVSRVMGSAGITRRENPFYELGDTRRMIRGRVESAPADWLRIGGDAELADVTFGELDDRLAAFGADAEIDTRVDPAFPRNAMFAHAGVERLSFDRGVDASGVEAAGSSAVRFSANGAGYVGLFRQVVLAVRAQSVVSTEPLPPFEQSLLGGITSLRGSDVGSRAGDNLAAGSVEIRMPLTSPLGLGRFGVKAFADAAAVYASGASLADQRFSRGYGAGVFVHATVFSLEVDVGWPEEGGGPNAHVQLGLSLGR